MAAEERQKAEWGTRTRVNHNVHANCHVNLSRNVNVDADRRAHLFLLAR